MSNEVQAQVFTSSNGAIQQHFNIGLVRELIALAPPATEQIAIVTFLNRETEKIDQLLRVRREQIERLQEQHRALIHHAVVKGIDPEASTKPSGHPWLEDIPKHWDVVRLKFLAQINPSKSTSGYSASDEDEVVFLPMESIKASCT